MKKLMILGAGYTQIPLYQAAKRLGITTVACSIPGNYDGFAFADEISYTDISDPEAVTKAAREFCIDGIATCGLDLGMRSIGHACEELNLPGPSKLAALTVSDKALMKDAFEKGGVRTAKHFRVHTADELENAMSRLKFPVMLKAVDQMGGRGIFKSDTPEEARMNFPLSLSASKKDYCIIEEFIEGPLFGVEAMIQNGRFVFFMPDNTEIFRAATDIPVGHSVPLKHYDERIDDIRDQITKAVRSTGLDNCPVNADCIQCADQVYVVEITGRPGATGLSEIVGLKYGLDYYEEIVKLALGMDVSKDFSHESLSCGILTHTLTAERKGVVRSINNFVRRDDEIIDLSFNIEGGQAILPFTNGRDRIGQVILKCDSLDACKEKLAEIKRQFRIDINGDVPLAVTPIEKLCSDKNGNQIYVKNESKLEFSYGGNKVRFAYEYYKDMLAKGCDAMILYGGYSSNLCRILAQWCHEREIPCAMVYNTEDSDPEDITLNASIIRSCNVLEFRCTKADIAPAVQKAMDYFTAMGKKPYYIHGNIYGKGNVTTPMKSYADVFYEILHQERCMGTAFGHIFLAGSTNTSQAGLLAASLSCGEYRDIVGISVNRNTARAREVILEDLQEYARKNNIHYKKDPAEAVTVTDRYLLGGYGQYNEELETIVRNMWKEHRLPLDPTYTGKAWYGMTQYIEENNIQNSNILFIHTGGIPLFLDYMKKQKL